MDILAQARKDLKKILNGGFSVDCTFDDNNGSTVSIKGVYKSHRVNVDTDGLAVNSLNTTITVHEEDLLDNSYPVRNNEGYVDLIGHLVSFKDSTGSVKDFIIDEQFPDETLGTIVLILKEYG